VSLLEATLFRGASGVVALHLVDEAVVDRPAGTMPVSAEWIALTSPSIVVPRANAGHRRLISAASSSSYGTPTASRLSRYGAGSIAASGGKMSMPPVRVMSGSSASRSTSCQAS